MNIRKITSMTMIWSLIVLTINSLVLYVVPEGRISYWADWRFLGLTKHDWSAQHTTVGFLFLFAGLLHIYLNWKLIVSYMKDKAKKVKVFTTPSNIGLALTIIFVIGTYLHIPPLITIVDLSENIKESASKKYGDPPYGQAQSSSLKMFTGRLGLDLTKSIELLEGAGVTVSDERETIREIAKRSGNSPQDIYDIIQPATTGSSGADVEGSDHTSEVKQIPQSGMGKKTIAQVCEEIGQDCDIIIKGLKEKGIDAEADQKLKDLAGENNTGSMQMYEAMVEIGSGAAAL